MITVRRSTPDDALAVATVHVRGWKAAFIGVFPQSLLDGLDPQRRAASYTFDRVEENFTLVAEDGGAIVGFVTCGSARPHGTPDERGSADAGTAAAASEAATSGAATSEAATGEIRAIYVDPDRWSKGIGRALTDAAVAELRHRGYQQVVLWTARDTPQSHRFYERYGFGRDGGVDTFVAGGGSPDEAAVTVVRYRLSLNGPAGGGEPAAGDEPTAPA